MPDSTTPKPGRKVSIAQARKEINQRHGAEFAKMAATRVALPRLIAEIEPLRAMSPAQTPDSAKQSISEGLKAFASWTKTTVETDEQYRDRLNKTLANMELCQRDLIAERDRWDAACKTMNRIIRDVRSALSGKLQK